MSQEDRVIYMTGLAVDQYVEGTGDYDDDKDAAFELAGMSEEDAGQAAIAELEEVGLKNLVDFVVVGADFVEFDSPNIGHANAMYEVELSGITQKRIDELFDLA